MAEVQVVFATQSYAEPGPYFAVEKKSRVCDPAFSMRLPAISPAPRQSNRAAALFF
jgi:hypothetical protein